MNKSLWQITPSIFNTLGLNTENSLGLAKSDGSREILYLIDGLGLLALDKYREFAPNLSAMNSTHQMQTAFPAITGARICGHSDIAPGRKTDPGPAFDWARYRAALAQEEGQ